ncbi:MAG: FadR family transcriptional regulator [Firmicutes bacterium]|jgi:GntR family transcriptional repressor for pyruvate dehydrogenase complex|nr:FadR family transcriptional regulator [Bacillota bacterium]
MRAELDGMCGKLDRVTLSQEVADRIQRLIVDQSLEVGTMLPSENSLAQSFGVSRTVIREAFKVLKAKGLVDVQPGKGTVVRSPGRKSVSDTIKLYLTVKQGGKPSHIEALYEIREVLECRIAELAAARRTPEDLCHLRDALERMKEQQEDAQGWTRADLEYHRLLARSTQNDLFLLLLQPIAELLGEVIYRGWTEPSGADQGIAAHEAILRAIEEQSPEEARRLMADHVEDSRQRVRRTLQA